MDCADVILSVWTNLTIALQCTWQSLSGLQSLALNGKYGHTPSTTTARATINIYHDA